MNVLMISPGFPKEMKFFTRGLAVTGAKVIGLGDQAQDQMPPLAAQSLAAHLHVSFGNDDAIVEKVAEFAQRVPIHRVECLWEPYMILAARIRERLGLPGLTVQQTIPYRDKEVMKRVLDAAGIRTPHHYSATTAAGVVEAAETIGFPVIVKPIDGAGSESTYKVTSREQLDAVLPALRSVTEVSVEEFVDGEDMTFDTLCVNGEVQHYSIATYIPRALFMKENEWVSPITLVIRDPDTPDLAEGKKMGFRVLEALGFQTGYTHMEWYRTPSGEAVFGEIGARPPGAGLVDLINYASDIDTYSGWAECVVHGRFTQPVERRYSAAWIYKRARGHGRIRRYEGLESILTEFGSHIVDIDLNPIGSPRRDWRSVLVGDGLVVVRHPDLETTRRMAEHIAAHLHIVAG